MIKNRYSFFAVKNYVSFFSIDKITSESYGSSRSVLRTDEWAQSGSQMVFKRPSITLPKKLFQGPGISDIIENKVLTVPYSMFGISLSRESSLVCFPVKLTKSVFRIWVTFFPVTQTQPPDQLGHSYDYKKRHYLTLPKYNFSSPDVGFQQAARVSNRSKFHDIFGFHQPVF